MASWSTIPDSALIPGAPIRSLDGLSLRDNPIAIAEGASGAPRVANIALRETLIGDVPLLLNDTERTTFSTAYTKLKESLIARKGSIRVKFDLQINLASDTGYGRIYVNGIAAGTERSVTGTTSFVTFTETINNINVSDLLQIYARTSNGSTRVDVANFRLSIDEAIESLSIL